jgi:hypothetical protein
VANRGRILAQTPQLTCGFPSILPVRNPRDVQPSEGSLDLTRKRTEVQLLPRPPIYWDSKGGKPALLSSIENGKGQIYVDDEIRLTVTSGGTIHEKTWDLSNDCNGKGNILPPPIDIRPYLRSGKKNVIKIELVDLCESSNENRATIWWGDLQGWLANHRDGGLGRTLLLLRSQMLGEAKPTKCGATLGLAMHPLAFTPTSGLAPHSAWCLGYRLVRANVLRIGHSLSISR